MDLNNAAITMAAFALGAVFQAVVGLLTAEYKAQKDESRAVARERRQALRDARLATLSESRERWDRHIRFIIARAGGDRRRMSRLTLDQTPLTRACLSFIGDPEVVDRAMRTIVYFLRRPARAPFTDDDNDRLYGVDREVSRAFRRQEEAILRDEAPRELTDDEYEAIFGRRAHDDRFVAADVEWGELVASKRPVSEPE